MKFLDLKYYNLFLNNIKDIDITDTENGKRISYTGDFIFSKRDTGFAIIYDYIKNDYDINEVFKDEEKGTIYTDKDIYNMLCKFFNQKNKDRITFNNLLSYFKVENDFDEESFILYNVAFDNIINTKNLNIDMQK